MISDEYAAGLIDGEGMITMQIRTRREDGRRLEMQTEIIVAVTMVERAPLDALAEKYGGKVYLVMRDHPRYRDAFRYQVNGRTAERVIRAVRPHLLIKHRQADLCIEQREHLLQGGRASPERAAYNARAMARRAELLAEIRALNRRGRAAA